METSFTYVRPSSASERPWAAVAATPSRILIAQRKLEDIFFMVKSRERRCRRSAREDYGMTCPSMLGVLLRLYIAYRMLMTGAQGVVNSMLSTQVVNPVRRRSSRRGEKKQKTRDTRRKASRSSEADTNSRFTRKATAPRIISASVTLLGDGNCGGMGP